jgi:hypothetical protein
MAMTIAEAEIPQSPYPLELSSANSVALPLHIVESMSCEGISVAVFLLFENSISVFLLVSLDLFHFAAQVARPVILLDRPAFRFVAAIPFSVGALLLFVNVVFLLDGVLSRDVLCLSGDIGRSCGRPHGRKVAVGYGC